MDILELNAGASLPTRSRNPITRRQLFLYAEASGDINPIHLDDEVAQKSGFSGVIAHGMLSMAFLGEYIYSFLNDDLKIESFSCRFRAKTFPGDIVSMSGIVKSNDGQRIALILETRNQNGVLTSTGQASIMIQKKS